VQFDGNDACRRSVVSTWPVLGPDSVSSVLRRTKAPANLEGNQATRRLLHKNILFTPLHRVHGVHQRGDVRRGFHLRFLSDLPMRVRGGV
jgi:hypothetical protein